ncbi:hypothetical protein ATM56_005113 [Salmonella enterica subsp. enterica serovar Isangi]|nr:hypothetical protein [Salmonella enterica]EDW5004536.1 hypothetical protein [Salmonella enterica subsp. enterica serovar Isangi]EHF9647248.1 hypothetical protein [Salmonella enterica]
MKKTLIALAVAASAVVSGSAMAWTNGGNGGSVEIGGTLTPQTKIVPWDVSVGAAVNDLNANILKGESVVSVSLANSVPVLGIRNVANGFKGAPVIDPQINYNGVIDSTQFMEDGKGQVYLNATVNDDAGNKIGTMKTILRVAAQANNGIDSNVMLYASSADQGFFGGLPRSESGVFSSSDAYSYAVGLFPGIVDTWSDNGTSFSGTGEFDFSSSTTTYHAYYASGIPSDAKLVVTLDQPATGDSIPWKVSLPISVTYN